VASGARLPEDSGRKGDQSSVFRLEGEAHALADRLPELILDALHVANTVAHGIHGRRRAGTGETFWQFRQFQASDPATVIDWRRSASSDHLYVREREWEAAHTFWLWPTSLRPWLPQPPVADLQARPALVLTLAVAELLVRAGERIALIGLTRRWRAARPHRASPRRSPPTRATPRCRRACRRRRGFPAFPARCCSAISSIRRKDHCRPSQRDGRGRRSPAIWCRSSIPPRRLGVRGPHGVPFPEGNERWIADRVETLRPEYRKKLAAHRARIEEAVHRIGWSFLVHHTDRPASEPLLTLMMRLQGHGGRLPLEAAGSRGGGTP